MVDRLLDSPHFGERLAMFWLDLVRYADSVGYHGDQPLSVSPFRDFVIKSFNENKPFDQFTIEQLAGDLLSNATSEQRIGSGYNRLGMMSAEGGAEDKGVPREVRRGTCAEFGGAFLGITLGCCECHDHKYDPLMTREFYGMEAFFADISEYGFYSGGGAGNWGPSVAVPTFDEQVDLAGLEAGIAATQQTLATATPELDAESPGKRLLPVPSNGSLFGLCERKQRMAPHPDHSRGPFYPRQRQIAGDRYVHRHDQFAGNTFLRAADRGSARFLFRPKDRAERATAILF